MKSSTNEKLSITFVALSLLALAVVPPLYFTGTIGRTPKVGDYYISDYLWDNPYVAHETNTITGVSNGYVCYSNSKGSFTDTVVSMRNCYTHVGHVPPPKPLVEDPR